jgi:excisionase family DNA binding protein
VNENRSKDWNDLPRRHLLNIEEASALLNVPKAWLSAAVTARTVPFTKIGKHVRFSEGHIEQIIRAGERTPAGEVAIRGTARSKL